MASIIQLGLISTFRIGDSPLHKAWIRRYITARSMLRQLLARMAYYRYRSLRFKNEMLQVIQTD